MSVCMLEGARQSGIEESQALGIPGTVANYSCGKLENSEFKGGSQGYEWLQLKLRITWFSIPAGTQESSQEEA